jgi:hypothetical protein
MFFWATSRANQAESLETTSVLALLEMLKGILTGTPTHISRLECPQKVQTTQTFTHRVFQLNSSKHVVSRRVEAFGIVDVLQKRLEASLSDKRAD